MKSWLKKILRIRSREKGVALVIVVVMIAIMLPIVTDMNYEAKTEFDLAMNYKRKAEAQALAASAVSFAVIIFDLQKQVESILKKFNMGQSIEIWDIVPFDTQLLRSFTTAGPMADVEDIVGMKNQEGEDRVAGSALNDQTEETYTETGDPILKVRIQR